MIALIFAILLTLIAFQAGKFVRKNNVKIYIVASFIAILAFIFQDIAVFKPVLQGFVGFSLIYTVMLVGAFNKKSTIAIKLSGIRREYSIIGFILITPHALMYLFEMLDGIRDFGWYGIIAYLLMIPLFITSFTKIRKKMSRSSWVSLQRMAYIVYILLFIHLILNASVIQNLIAYLIMFVPYFIFKILKEYNTYKINS